MAADLEYDIKGIDDLLFKMKSFKNAYIESSELDSRTTKISAILEFLDNYSSKYNNCMSEYDFINYKKKISSSVNNFTDDYLDLYRSTEYSRTLLNLGTASATQILNQFSGVATYGNSSSYGNSSFTPKTTTPSTTPKDDTDDDTGADKSKDGTTSPYTQNPGNGDTAAHPTDDGTSKDPKVDEEEQKRKEEEQKRQEEEKKRKEEEQKRQEEEKKRKEEEKKRKEEEQKRQEEEKKRKEEEQKRQEEEKKRQEEEKKRQEEEQKRQEEERRRQEEEQKRKEDNSNTGSEVAIPTGPSSSDNNNRTPERVTVPNTETTDNPVAAGIETSKPETTTTTESASTSVVGETKDLFKNKKTPDSKTGTGTTLPKSESTNLIPYIGPYLGAAVAGGVGLKAYKDHKENAKFDDENEDSFSNGNRFWSEEDPNVINSEETAVSGDELFAEQTTSPSYSAMANDANQDDGGWSLDESSTQPEEAFDLLGDN